MIGIENREREGIWMTRWRTLAVEHDICFGVERNKMVSGETQNVFVTHGRHDAVGGVRINSIWCFARKTKYHGLVRTVALPGPSKRSEQVDTHMLDTGENSRCNHGLREGRSSLHRPHRVRG